MFINEAKTKNEQTNKQNRIVETCSGHFRLFSPVSTCREGGMTEHIVAVA